MAPNSDQERGQLYAADRHIAELKQRIARQRRVITKLRLAKEPTDRQDRGWRLWKGACAFSSVTGN
jgi:hypothetical protein